VAEAVRGAISILGRTLIFAWARPRAWADGSVHTLLLGDWLLTRVFSEILAAIHAQLTLAQSPLAREGRRNRATGKQLLGLSCLLDGVVGNREHLQGDWLLTRVFSEILAAIHAQLTLAQSPLASEGRRNRATGKQLLGLSCLYPTG